MILGRAIKMQETIRFLPILGDENVDSFLETCRNQLHWNSELNIETEIVCAKR